MRHGRAAMHLALPSVGLAALAVMGAVRPAASPAAELLPQTGGSGTVAPVVVVRVITDGRPQLITLPATHPSLVVTATAPVRRPAARTTRRSQVHVVALAPPARTTAPAPRPAATQQQAPSNGYPYANDTGSSTDPWGFTERQCVSYVAWRLADAGRAIDNTSQGWGSAYNWATTARRLGYVVSTRPTVGAVAQWDANESSPFYGEGSSTPNGTFVAGSYGHVAWVTKVYSDGSVQLAQYNGSGDRSYSTMRAKAPRYLRL